MIASLRPRRAGGPAEGAYLSSTTFPGRSNRRRLQRAALGVWFVVCRAAA